MNQFTRPIGKPKKGAIKNKIAELEYLRQCSEKQIAALQAELAEQNQSPDLSKADPESYRLEYQRADRRARDLEKRKCDLQARGVEQEFCAITGMDKVYKKLCQILESDFLAAEGYALQCKVMWYACLLACYDDDRAKCVEYIQCHLEENKINTDDLPFTVADKINQVVFNTI